MSALLGMVYGSPRNRAVSMGRLQSPRKNVKTAAGFGRNTLSSALPDKAVKYLQALRLREQIQQPPPQSPPITVAACALARRLGRAAVLETHHACGTT
ncbi:MAG: hypothetical protein N2C14_02835 [Planctomycetales bacterium]